MKKIRLIEILVWAITGIIVLINQQSNVVQLKIQYGILWISFLLLAGVRYLEGED